MPLISGLGVRCVLLSKRRARYTAQNAHSPQMHTDHKEGCVLHAAFSYTDARAAFVGRMLERSMVYTEVTPQEMQYNPIHPSTLKRAGVTRCL